jgi:hypothetical protein
VIRRRQSPRESSPRRCSLGSTHHAALGSSGRARGRCPPASASRGLAGCSWTCPSRWRARSEARRVGYRDVPSAPAQTSRSTTAASESSSNGFANIRLNAEGRGPFRQLRRSIDDQHWHLLAVMTRSAACTASCPPCQFIEGRGAAIRHCRPAASVVVWQACLRRITNA